AGAGRNVASAAAPVCSPVPRTEAVLRMERLGLGLMGSAHQGLELVHDLRQAIQRRLRTEVLAVVARRETRDRRAGRDVANHAALHRHPRAATDAHVIGDPGLTGEEHIVPHVRAPGDPDAGGNEAPRPDADVVPHLDQVVDFRSLAHHRVVHAATVDRGVRPDLHVVPDDAAADLRDLARQRGVLARDVPEPVRPQPRPGVDDDPVTDARPTVAHDVRVEQHLVAELDAACGWGKAPVWGRARCWGTACSSATRCCSTRTSCATVGRASVTGSSSTPGRGWGRTGSGTSRARTPSCRARSRRSAAASSGTTWRSGRTPRSTVAAWTTRWWARERKS